MSNLPFLTLLAFIAGSLLLVEATVRGRERRQVVLNESYFEESEYCHLKEGESCLYTEGCTCKPPPTKGYIRERHFFFSPEHGRCFKHPRDIGTGCNSFEKEIDCYRQCERKLKFKGWRRVLKTKLEN
uniref:Putative tick kunitz 82 n=1 Tax=Amblyomma cajennense TaxID=34607 RepID=A0A023FPZ3_AMBCJ